MTETVTTHPSEDILTKEKKETKKPDLAAEGKRLYEAWKRTKSRRSQQGNREAFKKLIAHINASGGIEKAGLKSYYRTIQEAKIFHNL